MPLDKVEKRLKKLGANLYLSKGDYRKTLPSCKGLPKMDFIYIDGGNSYDVVKSSWENVQKFMHARTTVLFYGCGDEGVKKVVEEIMGTKGFMVTIISPHSVTFPLPIRVLPVPQFTRTYGPIAIVRKINGWSSTKIEAAIKRTLIVINRPSNVNEYRVWNKIFRPKHQRV